MSMSSLCECQDKDYEELIQDELDAPMPWIGMYIAAASLICTLAMAIDALNAITSNKLWFRCNYFSLNATSLTLLAVAMKLTVDLTSSMMGLNDKIATVSSLVLISVAMANFMMSVASMASKEILLNLTALGIFVITISVNVIAHVVLTIGTRDGTFVMAELFFVISFMLVLFVLLCSLGIVVPTTNRIIDSKFNEMHKMVVNEIVMEGGRKVNANDLSRVLKKYWVMAETGSPQYVIVRSAFSVIPGVMCLFLALCLVEAHIRVNLLYSIFSRTESAYKWSVNWILYIQTGGVAIGTVGPVSRWFVAARCKSLWPRSNSLKLEDYWIQILVDWRERPMSLRIRYLKFKKVVHALRRLLLEVCIKIQLLVILANKLILIFSEMCIAAVSMVLRHINKLKLFAGESESGSSREIVDDFSRYALYLEGEVELPKKTIANICNELDKLIQVGKLQKPKNAIQLLLKSDDNFDGVAAFDSNEVTSLHAKEPRVCWSLSVVTLTSIAVALPNIPGYQIRQLLSGVSEGLSLVKLVEKTMNLNADFTSVRDAAETVWVHLELYQKWQEKDITRRMKNMQDVTYKDTVLELSEIARKTIMDFKDSTNGSICSENPLKWPVKVIAANSMYRICQTLLLAEHTSTEYCTTQRTDEQIFEWLTIMIADILAACFTNLAHVIITMCKRNGIEESQESIRHAAILLGESEEIIMFLEQRDWPRLEPGKTGYLEAWQATLEEDKETPVTFAPNADVISAQLPVEHISIELGRS